jgi:hypothetical protein
MEVVSPHASTGIYSGAGLLASLSTALGSSALPSRPLMSPPETAVVFFPWEGPWDEYVERFASRLKAEAFLREQVEATREEMGAGDHDCNLVTTGHGWTLEIGGEPFATWVTLEGSEGLSHEQLIELAGF